MTVSRASILKVKFRLFFFILIFYCFVGMNHAQRYFFNNYSSDDGLSQMNARAIVQDRDGFLWIGTEAGLNYFDGYHFKIYTIHQGLVNDFINCISQDLQGNIWVGSNDGLSMIDGETIINYTTADGLPDKKVFDLVVDKNDGIWCATRKGLVYLDHGVAISDFKNKGLPDTQIDALLIDPQDRLWVGSQKGLFYLKDSRFHRFSNHVIQDYAIRDLAWDKKDRLWVALHDSVYAFDETLLVGKFSYAQGLTEFPVMSLHAGSDGSLWIGCQKGIFRLADQKVQRVLSTTNIEFRDITCMTEDREGMTWIGHSGGLANLPGTAFTTYTEDDGLGSNTARPILRDSKGILWVGTLGGLSRFDGNSWRNFTQKDGLNSNIIHFLYEDKQGILYIGTQYGLNYREGNRFLVDRGVDRAVKVFSIIEDREGYLWLSLENEGLVRGRDHRYQKMEVPGESISNGCLVMDDKGQIWASGDHGLVRWNGKNWRLFSLSDGLASNDPYFLAKDHSGNIWFGYHSSHGVTCYDGKRFTTYTSADGLYNDAVYSIGVDHENNIWLGTARGVDKFDRKQFINFGKSEGYASNESNAGGFFADVDGSLWFSTYNGISHYVPGKDTIFQRAPHVIFKEFSLGKSKIPFDKQITVPYSLNDLHAQIACLSFINRKRIEIRYRLEGYDDEWKSLEGYEIIYTNLPPGGFELKVQGRKYKYDWSEPDIVSFVIRSPFWLTWWFFVLCFLFLGTLIVGVYRFRLRKLNRKKSQLEEIIEERTSQLKKAFHKMTQYNKQLNEANRELEKLSIVAREIDNAVLIMDAEGNVEWINQGFTRMYGATLEQWISKRGRNLIESSSNKDIDPLMKRCLHQKVSITYDSLNHTLDHKEMWTQTTLTPILGPGGNVERIIAIDSDISKIKEAEMAAESANLGKSEFLARMSHEIRTPMNGVIGFADMLIDTGLNEMQLDYTKVIKRSGEALITILNDILDFSKIEARELTFEPIDFDPEVTAFDVCDLILPRISDRPVELLCRILDNVPAFVKSDAGRFRQVLVNLMGNAAKFTESGEIELSIEIIEETEDRLKMYTKVRDTGIGIPEEKIEDVFNVFQQADGSITRKFGGTGLGLAICREIAKLMGGEVWVDSQVGKGSVFHFTAWMDKSTKSPKPDITWEILKGKRVLIVDDNKNNLDILTHLLNRSQMEVTSQYDGEQVIQVLKESYAQGHPFDICITDVQLPGISGYTIAQQIRKLEAPLNAIPLLAFSSSTISRSSVYKESGFDGFLPKPVRRKKLLKMVERLLGKKADTKKKASDDEFATRHSIMEDFKHSVRILLAEDNPINQKLARYMLSKAGYRLSVAENGREAVEMFTATPEQFDLIFMDVQMPEMDGRAAAREIRSRGFTQIPIIAMTAESMKGDKEKCLDAGMNDYISKPIKREKVFEMIKKWCLE